MQIKTGHHTTARSRVFGHFLSANHAIIVAALADISSVVSRKSSYMKILHFIKTHFIYTALVMVFVASVPFAGAYFIVEQHTDQMVRFSENIDMIPSDLQVGIVFGGGIDGSEPTPLVKERLDTAKRLLDDGIVDSLILSGDNRFLSYNEPAVMLRYLTDDLGVDPTLLQEDFAGRSTYETCERASKVFGLTKAVLVSQNTHLPRAIYLCEHFGIQSYGVVSEGPASSKNANSQGIREVLARTKAVFNANIIGEKTILGESIEVQ